MWMRWEKIPRDADNGNATPVEQPRAGQPAGDAIADARQSRAHHAHCAFGQPFFATRRVGDPGEPPTGMSPFERRDMPYIIGAAIIVLAVIIVAKLLFG